jgi:hypothetical protein
MLRSFKQNNFQWILIVSKERQELLNHYVLLAFVSSGFENRPFCALARNAKNTPVSH